MDDSTRIPIYDGMEIDRTAITNDMVGEDLQVSRVHLVFHIERDNLSIEIKGRNGITFDRNKERIPCGEKTMLYDNTKIYLSSKTSIKIEKLNRYIERE